MIPIIVEDLLVRSKISLIIRSRDMAKQIVGYCPECGEETKHTKLECTESLPWRVFEVVTTMGFGLLFDRTYKCECSRCGKINEITKG